MEGFLRAYYTNLNPNATEEEILAYLASKRAGRLDITPDSAIMPGRPQGAAEGSDTGFENTQSNESFNADANLGTSDYGYI